MPAWLEPLRERAARWAGVAPAAFAMALVVAPRSAYVLEGDAHWRWQHAIAPAKELRWSITLRTRVANGRGACATR